MITSTAILKANILIVDDRASNIDLLHHMLQLAGYTSVASTSDPFEVCNLHRANQYDLILLDLQMPGMDGFQVMEGLKEIELEGYLPVLVITGQPEHKLRALQLGAKDVISKPFEKLEILARIYNMLEIRLLNREAKNQSKILEQLVQDLQKQIITDPLTNLFNRRFLQEYLPREIAKARRNAGSLAVLMIDLDFFKKINDIFGHEAGDVVLKNVATLLKDCIRESDVACRYGGEEFVLFCLSPHQTERRRKLKRASKRGYEFSANNTSEVAGKGKHINRRGHLPGSRGRHGFIAACSG